MARELKDIETDRERAVRVAHAIASLPDPGDYAAVVGAVLASETMTAEEREAKMTRALERLRELHTKTLEKIGRPLPDGYGARMVREGRP